MGLFHLGGRTGGEKSDNPDGSKASNGSVGDKIADEMKSKYQSIAEETDIGAASIDMKGNFTSINDALCMMTGYTKDEFLGEYFLKNVHQEDENGRAQKMAKELENPLKSCGIEEEPEKGKEL